MKDKKHLTVEGLDEIVRIKASLNLGLSDEIKTAFFRKKRNSSYYASARKNQRC